MSSTAVLLVLILLVCVSFGMLAAFVIVPKSKHATPSTSTNTAGNLGTAVAGSSGKTNITFYGQSKADDNGEGFAGIDLFKHGQAGIKFQNTPVYPAAVHQNYFADFGYKILQVSGQGIKTTHVHVVDVCDAKQAVCNNNVKKNGLNFLVDIHATGFNAAGKSDGIATGTYKIVGEIRPGQLPKTVWMPKVQAGKDSMLCSCTGTCSDKQQKWVTLSHCK